MAGPKSTGGQASNLRLPSPWEKRVDLITTANVMACLTPMWHEKPGTARRVKQRIAAVMKWCIAQGFRENNQADERITAALGVC